MRNVTRVYDGQVDRKMASATSSALARSPRARAAATDVFAAVDEVVDKLEHQMTKLKGKLVGRSHPRRAPSVDSMDDAAGGDS